MFWPEVGLIEASGNGKLRNLTQSGYADSNPKWVMGGEMMIWLSNRQGNRAENGFSSEGDVFGMFFTQEAYDKYLLSKEDLALLKEQEEDAKEEKDTDDGKKKKKGDKKSEETSKNLKINFENLTKTQKKVNGAHIQCFGLYTFQRGRQIVLYNTF